ncbi:hypothetical protein [Selenomonas ruminantium]|uniref:hypothetical protein n=1 Tax=Selenomonas ruminantium TaxID=971 RepID=UPI0026EDE9F3|nr:hypothetical protein [Selenomonas ruminantium]
MENKNATHIYTANENDRNWSMPTELEVKAAYKRYNKFKDSGVIELDMCCYCKSDLVELLSYQINSLDEIDGYSETLYYIEDDKFLRVLEECDALSGEIFNFDDAYNWIIKYYDATMSKSVFEECVKNTIMQTDRNVFFDRRVEKWKEAPDSDPALSQAVRDGKYPDLLPFLYLFVDEDLPVDIERGGLTIAPRPKSFSKKYLDKKNTLHELELLHGKYARLPKSITDSDYIYIKNHLTEEIELCNKVKKLKYDEYASTYSNSWVEQLLYVAVCSVSLKELNEIQKLIERTDAPNIQNYSRLIKIAKRGIEYREKFMNMLDIGTEYKQVDLRKIYERYLEKEFKNYSNELTYYIPEKIEYLVNESVDAGLWKKENRKTVYLSLDYDKIPTPH